MKRYDLESSRDGVCYMEEWGHGEYARYEDVVELERRYREAVELLRKVEETMRLGCHHDLVQNNVELINAFLDEEDAHKTAAIHVVGSAGRNNGFKSK